MAQSDQGARRHQYGQLFHRARNPIKRLADETLAGDTAKPDQPRAMDGGQKTEPLATGAAAAKATRWTAEVIKRLAPRSAGGGTRAPLVLLRLRTGGGV